MVHRKFGDVIFVTWVGLGLHTELTFCSWDSLLLAVLILLCITEGTSLLE